MKNEISIPIGGFKKVVVSEILYLQADQNYTKVFLASGQTHLVATTLGILQKRLNNYGFVRPNRQMVVNVNFISEVGAERLKLKNKQVVRISRRRKVVTGGNE